RSLGQHPIHVRSQAEHYSHHHPEDAAFVENVMWQTGGVLFVTINLPGGSNNDTDVWFGAATPTQEQLDEVATRTAADLRWVADAFDRAHAHDVSAVVIQLQA